MRCKRMGSLTLLLLAAAAVPPGPCGPAGNTGSGSPTASADAARDTGFPAFSGAEDACEGSGTEPASVQTPKPDNDTGDALHGLPSSEALRPLDQPRQAPIYR